MKKKLFAILLCGVMALGLAGCRNPVSDSKKELEDAKNDLEETYKKYGWVEKETVNTILAKFNTEIMDGGLNTPASDDYMVVDNGKYWFALTDDVAIKNSQIEEYVKTMASTYKNYSKDVKINFWERNNHKIGEMKFTTQGSDTEIYNHIIAFSVNDKLRLVNFNCTKEQMSEWQKVSKFIMDSIMFE